MFSSHSSAYIDDVFRPCLEAPGITVAGEWEVLIGDGPRTIFEGRAHDLEILIRNLQSEKLKSAKQGLKKYAEHYESRLLTFHVQKIKGYKSASYKLIAE